MGKEEIDLELTDEQRIILKQFGKSNLSPAELKLVLKQVKKGGPAIKRDHKHYFSRDHVKFGVVSDTHWGHKDSPVDRWYRALDYFKREGVEAIYHPGDVCEGMSGRPGHIYELSHVGATAQLDLAEELLNESELPIFGITGNHDEWFKIKGNMGLNIGEELERRVKNYTHLGDMEATVRLRPNVKMQLFHGRDGTAYAVSYKMQKLMESFTGGDKPNIVLSGHYHKSLYMFNRNIHGFESGTLCSQTPFMRGKKIPAHIGFWVIDAYFNKNGVDRVKQEFVPFYE